MQREVLSSKCDPMDIILETHLHDENVETWYEFTERMHLTHPGEDQELVFQDGKYGVRFRLLKRKKILAEPKPEKRIW